MMSYFSAKSGAAEHEFLSFHFYLDQCYIYIQILKVP